MWSLVGVPEAASLSVPPAISALTRPLQRRRSAGVRRQIAAQARQRLAGVMPPGGTRRVSLHDGDARPIAKGRLGKPIEFGHKAQVVDNDDGIVVDHIVEPGNPTDAPQLAPAIKRVIGRAGRTPRTVTADRGYDEKSVEDDLHELGVRTVVIPRKGRPSQARRAEEHRPAFRRTVKWRTGSEGRNSTPETRLRLGPHPPRHHRRCSDLDRTRHPRPQPRQDQRAGRVRHRQTRSTLNHAGPNPATPIPNPGSSGRSS